MIDVLDLPAYVGTTYAGNPWWRWTACACVIVGVVAVLEGARWLVAMRFKRRAAMTPTQVDDAVVGVLERTRAWFSIAIGLWAGLLVLELPDVWRGRVHTGAFVVVMLQTGLWGESALRWGIAQRDREIGQENARRTSLTLLRVLGVVTLWSVVLLIVLSRLGYDVSALLTGLGIGGVALALALQSILGDLFASVSIVLDKPFEVGDFIVVDQEMGTVQSIGLKTTRVTSLGGEQIAFANNDLLKARVHNYTRMRERRVVFRFALVLETPVDRLEELPALVRSIVTAIDRTRFDRCHFAEIVPHAFEFEVVYFALTPDYTVHMDIREQVNLALVRHLQERGLVLATPLSRVVVASSK